MPATSFSRLRVGAAAGALGAAAALALVTGAGPVPSVLQLTGATEDVSGSCDEAEHAGDPACAGDLTALSPEAGDDEAPTLPAGVAPAGVTPAVAGDLRTVSAGEAGSVIVAIEGGSLQLLTASPNPGWAVEVEHASGHEIEVQFRNGSQRVDVTVELEDGEVRERVRVREAATGDSDDGDSDDDDDDRHGARPRVEEDDPDGSELSDSVDSDDDSDDNDHSGPGVDSDDDSSGPGSDDGSDRD